ncbi:hypothetical protein BUALT_Bualt09G0087900 [Buddleja alternifolia]|uniref:Pre-mRNA cleavage complex 2 protein Pcf11 n=1 Tax=Buddleja alternifolia TaxID=168488 RepID=A0AAV6X5E9_9LAMI|nr:hypothetical protein BUALT_Bualt09G0087900 [Buddleja alternifolia]
MESARRPFGRSLSKEPGLKKPRIAEDPTAPDRSSNGRQGIIQRPIAAISGGGGKVQRERDSESGDSVRGAYQYQPGNQLHQELVNQYKTALAELTFNSKPIITNLTIIAGENSHAAKAIAATVCANIIEVPREQKLPSLYLLDSIVKNIGRDYIKHFASRLPEVFCKVYRQVDPSTHQNMRHLFGTWKGVFPPQTLQMIEKELGFTSTANGSSSGTTTSRPDVQAQRPANSIHVNPKYLEARQRLQTTRARGGSDISGALVSSHEDVEAPRRIAAVTSERSFADPYAKTMQHHHRDQVNDPVRDKIASRAYMDPEYGSNVSGRSGLGTGRVSEEFKEEELEKSFYESGSDVTGKLSNQKNGFDMKHGFGSYVGHKSANSDSHLQLKQNFASRSWKNSEEEEYMWDEMNTRPTDRGAADTSTKDHWAPDSYERLDFDSHLQRPIIDDEASADSLSTEMGQVASGTRIPLSWSEELHPPEGRMLSGPGRNISGYSEGFATGLKTSSNAVGKSPFQSQLAPTHIGSSTLKYSPNVMPGPKVSMAQQRQTLGAASSSIQSPMHHRPPSPSFSAYDPNQLLNNFTERNHTSVGPPTDPRRPPGQRNTGPRGQFSQDSLPLQPQSLRTSSNMMPPLQQRKTVPSTQKRKLEVSEFESSGEGRNLLSSQISGSESRNSSSDQSNPLAIDSPGQSITSSLLTAVAKSGILGSSTSLLGSSTNTDFQEAGLGSSLGSVRPPLPSGPTLLPGSSKEKLEQPPLPPGIGSEQNPEAVNSTSNPFSSLLSTLMAKGLISDSKSDSLLSASTKKPDQPPLDGGPGVASIQSTPVSSISVTMSKSLKSIQDEPSSSKPPEKAADALHESTTKIKNLIGFDFRPNIVRNFHADVISDLLSDLPHQCTICGLSLQLQEQLDRHMEWHSLRVPEQNPLNKTSRTWYASSVDWVSGVDAGDSASDLLEESDEALESSEQMVPADENQCACILCGELFEDFYSRERNEWMFKGAVYLTSPSSELHERTGTKSNTAILSPIVHVNCMSEHSIHVLGLACDVKLVSTNVPLFSPFS